MGRRLTPWQKIARAAARGTGLRLTDDEVLRLSQDQAIMTRAAHDDAMCPVCCDDDCDGCGDRAVL